MSGRVATGSEPLWFLGTLVHMRLRGADTAGRLGLWETTLPRDAAPPLHSHPQDETFYVIEGRLTVWLADADSVIAPDGDGASDHPWWEWTEARMCAGGDVMHAPGGLPHSFRVETDTARVVIASTPAGIEDMVLGLAEPARWPWLPAPADGPRVPAARMQEVERETGMRRWGVPPPAVMDG